MFVPNQHLRKHIILMLIDVPDRTREALEDIHMIQQTSTMDCRATYLYHCRNPYDLHQHEWHAKPHFHRVSHSDPDRAYYKEKHNREHLQLVMPSDQ